MKNVLPEQSQSHVLNGIWFVCHDELNTIKVFSSTSTGKEKVYLNEVLVSKKRSFSKKNSHYFEDDIGNRYEVKFVTTDMLQCNLTCSIIKNNEPIKLFQTHLQKGKNSRIKRLGLMIVASLTFASVQIHFQWPKATFFIASGLIAIVHFASYNYGEIIINEVEV